jgi:heme-degrading monooxygenase HmoA
MYLRIVKWTTQPGQVHEFARRWEVFSRSHLTAMPGFRHGHFAGDRRGTATAAVTVWDTRPGQGETDHLLERCGEQVIDIVAGPPTIEEYEILVEV